MKANIAIALAASVCVMALATPAQAQQRKFDIPAGSLKEALDMFGRQSGRPIIYKADEVRGARSPGYRGNASPQEALTAILASTGFKARTDDSGAIAIVRLGNVPAAASEATLPLADGDIVVTANKRSERLSDVPAAVNVVSKAFLDGKAANKLADYINYLPNTQLMGAGATGYARINIRGITVIGSGSSVGTYIDGIPFGSSTSFAAAANLQPDLDPSVLASIEVLKGPQGTLYGAGSTGGLIKYSTIAPDSNRFGASAAIEGSFSSRGGGGYGARLHVNVPILSDVAALSISGYARQDPGFVDNLATGKQDENTTNSKGFYAALLLTPSSKFSLRATALYQMLRSDGLDSIQVAAGTKTPVYGKYSTVLYAGPGNVARDELYGLEANYELAFATLTSITSYSWLRGSLSTGDSGYAYQDYGLASNDHLAQEIGGRTKKFTQEVRLTSSGAGRLKWMIGGFYTHEDSTGILALTAYLNMAPDLSIAPGGNVFTRLIPSTYNEYSGFANATLTIVPRLEVTVGGRYSSYQQHYQQLRSGAIGNPTAPSTLITYADTSSRDDALTYVAALKYSLPGNGLIYLRTASGYRVGGPTVLPIGAVPPAGFTSSFKPEKLTNYEVGFRRDFFNGGLNLDISAFYIDYRDMQGNIRIGRFTVTGNPGNATSKGVEASVRVKAARGLNVSGTFGYANPTLNEDSPAFNAKKGDILPTAVRYTAAGNVDYTVRINDALSFFANAGVRYHSSLLGLFSSDPSAESFPAETIFDFQFGIRNPTFSAVAFIKNLTNTYAYNGNAGCCSAGPASLSVTAPRLIGLRLSKDF